RTPPRQAFRVAPDRVDLGAIGVVAPGLGGAGNGSSEPACAVSLRRAERAEEDAARPATRPVPGEEERRWGPAPVRVLRSASFAHDRPRRFGSGRGSGAVR